MNVMARRIQNCFVQYRMNKQKVRTLSTPTTIIQERDRHSVKITVNELLTLSDTNPSLFVQHLGELDDETLIELLDEPWVPPSLKKAHHYANSVQPRRGGKNGTPFEFFSTTTGRHCFLGGFGEQFDLWEEGQISEFSLFGPGVTNYFKFMKWGFWLMVTITVISLPSLVLNVNGNHSQTNTITDSTEGSDVTSNTQYTSSSSSNSFGLNRIAMTTIGNLASTIANATVLVSIPGCNRHGTITHHDMSCTFNGANLAMFYSSLDVGIGCVIFIAFVWLIVFEYMEKPDLNDSTGKSLILYTCIY